MGGKKKRQFIDKKTAHKFNLVHRSQRDPLQADEDSAQHVLVAANGEQGPIREEEAAAGFIDLKEKKTKYGIYYDDDYDYFQHLKPRGTGILLLAEDVGCERKAKAKVDSKVSFGNLSLPTEALPSQQEEDIGMLNKGVLPRGPQPDWDPDIVAALDDGIDLDDPDNVLEDDFMVLAGGETVQDKDENDGEWETESDNSHDSYIDSDNLLSDEEFDDSDEETKSRFTNYSMTSSIIRRTEGLKILDDRFERIMEEYDEHEIGCIDHEDVAGRFDVNNELVTQVMEDFIDAQKLHELSETKNDEDNDLKPDEGEEEDDGDDDEKIFAQFERKAKEKWDCESIISTYSNLYNHPKLIIEPRKAKEVDLHKHTGIPIGVLKDKKKCNRVVEECVNMEENIDLSNNRSKNETVEEKKQRKRDVKELRKNRRVEKKNNKMAFKDEYKKQEKAVYNTSVQKGIKM